MAFEKMIGGERFEIEPLNPYSEEQIIQLIDDGSTVNEHHPLHVIKKRDTDEPIAEFKILDS